ncbi:hypothetical protein HQN89_02180 [Paenibacillus frigoriresistens]|uniref:hypothetical protein n=1 Tax=Paenibacillus alginolyticus TaxID=59839 RepID=UPI001564197E|nr:hypothetical protein [Paenibacillus frigoriresistens]NRF89847.1 hypothetical protein [Paenibacillus frigoriresistens]
MSFPKRKLIHVICLVAITLTALFSGCSDKTNEREQVVLEHYFYSDCKEGIEELHKLLNGSGYKMYEIRSYTADGTKEWGFSASKLLFVTEKTTEIDKIKKLSEKYHVNFKAEELPPERWGAAK